MTEFRLVGDRLVTVTLHPDAQAAINLGNTMIMAAKANLGVFCQYTNHRGHTKIRRFKPLEFWHGKTCYHTEAGLMLRAFDLDKSEERDFAVRDFDITVLGTL